MKKNGSKCAEKFIKQIFTPNVLSKINTSMKSDCWRKCGETKANHSHIFFFCAILKSIWHSVIAGITGILNMKKTLNPIYIILGKSPPELMQEIDQYLYRVLRIAALKQVTRIWLKPSSPSAQKWKVIILEETEYKK